MRIVLFLAIALVAFGVTMFVQQRIESGKVRIVETKVQENVVQEKTIGVLIAQRTLGVGSMLREGDVVFQPFPISAVRNEYITQSNTPDLSKIYGSVIRSEIAAAEAVLSQKLVKPGERGFLAAILRPGMKAASINLNNDATLAFVFPGDRVDILLTQTLPQTTRQEPDAPPQAPKSITETIIKNVKVVGVGQSLSLATDPTKPGQPANTGRSVTLELTPKLAEVTVLAGELGKLSIVLNPMRTKFDGSDPTEAEKQLENSYPYLVSGVTDGSYTATTSKETSPARASKAEDERIKVFRSEKTARKTENVTVPGNDDAPKVFRGSNNGTQKNETVSVPAGSAPQPLVPSLP
ncbi:MAG: Flp pilus assembly protein CpaB [Holosporales bacterium]|jgi:pilus assembly protein CpaB